MSSPPALLAFMVFLRFVASTARFLRSEATQSPKGKRPHLLWLREIRFGTRGVCCTTWRESPSSASGSYQAHGSPNEQLRTPKFTSAPDKLTVILVLP